MDLAQYFDTTITDCESGLAARLIVVPTVSMAPHARLGVLGLPEMLGLKTEAMLESEREMIAVLASLLRSGDPAAMELATVVVREPRLPLGEAGIQPASLLMIAKSNGEVFHNTVFQVSLREWRLVAVLAPVGMVLAGAAAAVAAMLESGLAVKIRELMGLDGRQFRSTGPAAVK
jgi:hypothetical protein